MHRNVAPSGLLESCEREHDRKGKFYYGNGWKNDDLRYEVKAKTTGDEIEEQVRSSLSPSIILYRKAYTRVYGPFDKLEFERDYLALPI